MGVRADVLLVKKGLIQSRNKARDAIVMGLVTADGRAVSKPSEELDENCELALTRRPYKYVSRAGDKLEAALSAFCISPKNAVCLDIGASTGGFTDCLLQHGAKKVYAVDVGKCQLDESLAGDMRVKSLEQTDIRRLQPSDIEPPDIITADVSFISLSLVLPSIKRLMADTSEIICLIKPQFEAGRAALNKNGVVTSEKAHISAVSGIISSALELSLAAKAIAISPVRGESGNTEYLLYLKKGGDISVSKNDIKNTVKEGLCR